MWQKIYAVLGKADMDLGASAMYMSYWSELLAAASVTAADAASLPTCTILCSRKYAAATAVAASKAQLSRPYELHKLTWSNLDAL